MQWVVARFRRSPVPVSQPREPLVSGADDLEITLSLWELASGETAKPDFVLCPACATSLTLLAGAVHIRTPSGWIQLTADDAVSFPAGVSVVNHQLVNTGTKSAWFAVARQAPEREMA